ncbi:energy-coupling factor transporter transmembrane component T family protein [Microbacterium aurantiacum]|uniref:energy-coupling factor transporter transmembrane component T family protein n=1 Tax=Microbacterium aurantiacum TaxID=162393 RepID=UPI000AF6C7F2
MSFPATAPTAVVDPYREITDAAPWRFLYRLNPLAKVAAVLPAIVLLVVVRDLRTPLVLLALGYLVLLVGVRMSVRLALILGLAVPAVALAIGLGLSLWTDAALVDDTAPVLQIGAWTLYAGALEIGFATGLRLAAILALSLIPGLSTTGPDLVRASIQQLRVPYRIGYTALAAFRFVPRFGHELEVIRQAHRVRGANRGRGPIAAVRRWTSYVVPLLAGAIRHAERVALAMDARAFGAYAGRTERHLVPFRARDVVFAILFWAASAAVFTTTFPWASA